MSHHTGIRSALGKVRGLGSAKTGAHHWWMERLSAIILVPLSLWFLIALVSHLGASREVVAAWIAKPHISVLMAALMLALFWHVKMGLQVVIEDYVHNERSKLTTLFIKDAVIYLLGAACLLAIVKIHLLGVA